MIEVSGGGKRDSGELNPKGVTGLHDVLRRALIILLEYTLLAIVYYALLLQPAVSKHAFAWLKEIGILQN